MSFIVVIVLVVIGIIWLAWVIDSHDGWGDS